MNTEWIVIIGIVLNLMNTVQFNGAYDLRFQWQAPAFYAWHAPFADSILKVGFHVKGDHQPVAEFLFLPLADYIVAPSGEPIAALPLRLYTVTEEAVIYRVNCGAALPDELKNQFDWIFDANYTLKPLPSVSPFPEQVQALKYEEYPFHVTFDVAIPGSHTLNPQTLAYLFPEKMILLRQIPDSGPIKTQWIKGHKLEKSSPVSQIISTLLSEAINNPEEKNRTDLYNKGIIELKEIFAHDDEAFNMFSKKLARWLMICIPTYPLPGENNLFSDYQPKVTPDLAVEFMPSIAPFLDSLPQPLPQNMENLIDLFKRYEQEADEKPGEWIKGNMILGAKPDEYIPSMAELLLNETGERLRAILHLPGFTPQKSTLQKKGYWGTKLCYTHFTFTHCDVMGSGRFFYTDTMENRCLKLKQERSEK